MRQYFFMLAAFFMMAACNTQKAVPSTSTAPPAEYEVTETRQLDTMTISAPRIAENDVQEAPTYELPDYQPSHTREHDLLHTRLDLRFDWEQEKVIGKATLKLKPYFYPREQLTLDAKNFAINSIAYDGQTAPLEYTYDGEKITIDLGKTWTADQEYTLVIDYIASPTEEGGSSAITSDKGLFFINPRGEDGDKPMQIWTQGETENNSRWFPTIDKPNERTTQEMYVTVDDRFVTLSNGTLQSSTKNEDGTRTDYWKLDQPHAPYLFMLAIGEFAVVKDEWNDIPVEYYVEPEYEEHARAIFPYTPEMLTFFSDRLDLTYPWPKYSQVVVRDYVSGAMENTTAVIYGEFMQRPARELIDVHLNEKIVAHELFHHWFGDYVTCESWANLTMNEGFANYSEYLWMEHKYGRDAADYHLLEEWSGYFSSAQNDVHPLIFFTYDDKEDMFDAHSYNKGGSVLHMLRYYMGDEAFFSALNRYLKDNAYEAVEAHDLRLAVEEVSGEDMNWFFNQWYFQQGHPTLEVEYGYEEAAGEASVTVRQTQDPETMPAIFELRTYVDVYNKDGSHTRYPVRVTEREQTFTFPAAEQPPLINFDPERVTLAVRRDDKTNDALLFQFYNAPRLLDRLEAMQKLGDQSGPQIVDLYQAALKDDFWLIRGIALQNVMLNDDNRALIRQMATEDERSEVRAAAFYRLAEENDTEVVEAAKKAIDKDQSYSVIAAALGTLLQFDTDAALTYAEKLADEDNAEIQEMINEIYVESGDPKYLSHFRKQIDESDGYAVVDLLDYYQQLAAKTDMETAAKTAKELETIALDTDRSQWTRFGAARAIAQMRDYYEEMIEGVGTDEKAGIQAQIDQLNALFINIKAKETDPQLKTLYDRF